MKALRRAVAVPALAMSLVAMAQQPDGPQAGDPASVPRLVLYARFEASPSDAWHSVSIDLTPGRWRVGSIDGPPADEPQLRAVLSDLQDLAIGGRCLPVQRERVSTCTFTFAEFDLAGIERDVAGRMPEGWSSATGATLLAIGGVTAYPQIEQKRRFGRASNDIAGLEMAVVQAPARFLGNRADAYGKALRFRFQVPRDADGRTAFDASQAVVILSSSGKVQVRVPPSARRT